MRILIATAGSHGDVAPLTGLGTALRGAGHDVTVAAFGMFEELVTGCGLAFHLIPGDPQLVQASPQGQQWQEHGTKSVSVSGIRFMRLASGVMRDVNAGILEAAQKGTDVLLLTGAAWFGGYRIAQALGLPSIGLALQPTHPTGQFPALGLTRSLGRWGNRALTRALMVAGADALNKPSNPLWAAEGMPGSIGGLYRRQEATRWPFIYGYSPAVVPRPPDWREGIEVAGYWWPRHPASWTPPADLERFLAAGPPPVFVGFGSRNPAGAARLTATVAAARRQAGVRMVVQAGWAGLGAELRDDDDVIVIGEAPHDWLFRKMAAVVHHAGAGTTAAGLRAGVPTVSVPMITDQPFWASRVTALGAGPKAVPYKSLSAGSLGAAIHDAVTRGSYRSQARKVAEQLAGEDGTLPVIRALDRLAA